MATISYDNAIALGGGIFWVGFYDEQADLHCNPYLIVDGGEGVLIDPGSMPHFSRVMRKVLDVINPQDISTIVVNHQDPDVCGNLAVVESLVDRPDLRIVMHSSAARLIRHLGVVSPFYLADRESWTLRLASGRELEFIHAPFLHSPFALMTFDRPNRTLFSGDLFGALSTDWALMATGDFLAPMEAWHRDIMPSNQVLKCCMEKLERLPIDRILPQHGSVLEGDQVGKAIACLKALMCGVDLEG